MSVEPATEADIPGIMSVERSPGFEHLVGRWSDDQHREEMAKPSVRYFVVRDSGEVAGFAIVQGLDDPDRKTHVKRIAVSRPGSGLGTELLHSVIGWIFRATDANRVDLDVFSGNERARRSYEKVGFVTEGLLREYHRSGDGSYRDMWLMSILRREWEQRA